LNTVAKSKILDLSQWSRNSLTNTRLEKQFIKMKNLSPTSEIQKANAFFLRFTSLHILPIEYDRVHSQFKLVKTTKKHEAFCKINSIILFSLGLLMLYHFKSSLNMDKKAQQIFVPIGFITAALLCQITWKHAGIMVTSCNMLVLLEQKLQMDTKFRVSHKTVMKSVRMGSLMTYGIMASAVIFWASSFSPSMPTNAFLFIETLYTSIPTNLFFRSLNLIVWYQMLNSAFIITESILPLASIRVLLFCCNQGIQNGGKCACYFAA